MRRSSYFAMSMSAAAVAVIAVAAVILMPVGGMSSPGRVIKAGVFDIEPLAYIDSGGAFRGLGVEALNGIAAKEGWRIQYVSCVFSDCLKKLDSGEIDVQVIIAYSDERAKKYDFTKTTLYKDWGEVHASADLKAGNMLDLDNKRVAMMEQSIQIRPFMEMAEGFGVKIEPVYVKNHVDVFKAVEDGRADALIVNKAFADRVGPRYNVRRTPIIFSPMDIRYAALKGKNSGLIKTIGSRLKAMIEDKDSEYHASLKAMSGLELGMVKAGMRGWIRWGGAAAAMLILLGAGLVFRRKVMRKAADLDDTARQYRALLESAYAIHWEVDASTRMFTYVSPRAKDILGYPPEAWRDFEFRSRLIHADDKEQALSYFSRMFSGAADRGELTYRIMKQSGEYIWVREAVSAGIGADGRLRGIMTDITSHKEIEERLAYSESFMRSIVENEPECVKLVDGDGLLVDMNPAGLKMIQADRKDQVCGRRIANLIEPEFRDAFNNLVKTVMAGEKGSLTFKINTFKGESLWVETHAAPFDNARNNRRLMLSVTRDVTERVKNEDEIRESLRTKEVLLKEIHHRVKNNMQIISSLQSLQSRYIKDPETLKLFNVFKNRVRAMALVHEKLYMSDNPASVNAGDYIGSLVQNLVDYSGHEAGEGRIACGVDADDIRLDMHTLIPCGLIINELVTNSIKYAFCGRDSGKIGISLKRISGSECELRVGDDGAGLPEGFDVATAQSLGLILVNALAKQLDAKMTSESGGGASFVFRIPLKQ